MYFGDILHMQGAAVKSFRISGFAAIATDLVLSDVLLIKN